MKYVHILLVSKAMLYEEKIENRHGLIRTCKIFKTEKTVNKSNPKRQK